mgnify:CR=1 FL=1
MAESTDIKVLGMSCGHCENAVREELMGIAGVTAVDVDLESGAVSITSDAPIARPAIAAAVDEAGYEVAG